MAPNREYERALTFVAISFSRPCRIEARKLTRAERFKKTARDPWSCTRHLATAVAWVAVHSIAK
jgi:hypothetical protein